MAQVPLRYNVRSLMRRPLALVLTTLGVSVSVAVLVAMLALVSGLSRTLADTGDPRNVVLVSRGALAESTSALPRDALRAVEGHPAVSKTAPEAVVVWTVYDAKDEMRMVPFRGVSNASFEVHPVNVAEGRRPGPGEAIVGRALLGEVPGLKVGETFRWGRLEWKTVGVLEAGGTAFESEVWGDVESVLEDDRRDTFSAATVRVADAASVPGLVRDLESDGRFAVKARAEPEYYRAQAGSSEPILALSFIVALLMGIASVFGAINTMQASLAARRTEIAVLRALGFSNGSIALSFLFESLVQTLPAGIIGCLLAFAVDGRRTTMMNMLSLGSVGFQLTVTPAVIGAGMAYAALIGVVSGIWPAFSASRIPLSQAMRG